MMQWHFLASQLDQRVSNMVYLPVRHIIERTCACEIAGMTALLASLHCSESESEADDTGEMHVVNLYDN